MGLLNSIQQQVASCIYDAPSTQHHSNYTVLDQDQKYILKEEWYRMRRTPAFDPNKLIFLYPEYSADMAALETLWRQIKFGNNMPIRDINDVILPKLKFVIRKGLPMSKMRQYLLDAFRLNQQTVEKQRQYNQSLNQSFKGKVPEEFAFVPLFGIQSDSLQQALCVYYVNRTGYRILSCVLWTLHKTKHIQYCPTIVHVASLLILYLEPWEIYSSLLFMVDDSINMHLKNEDSLRWHFCLNHNQMSRLAKSFFQTVTQTSSSFQEIVQHLCVYDIDQEKLFREFTLDIFLKQLPFPLVYRIFCVYINEGVKIYFRVIYALFITFKQTILKCQTSDNIIAKVFQNCVKLDRKQINQVMKLGFRLPLPAPYRNLSAHQDSGASSSVVTQIYFFPTLTGSSEILSSQHFELLWGFLPIIYKQDDPKIIFPSEKYGYSLSGLLESMKPYEDRPILLVVKDTQWNIFGAFFLQKLTSNIDINYTASSDTFVFRVEPQLCQYKSTGYNTTYCQIEQNYLTFGSGKSGPALQLQKDMWKGSSNQSETFNNERLHGGVDSQFKIQLLECFVLL